jgi:hypothetical protein
VPEVAISLNSARFILIRFAVRNMGTQETTSVRGDFLVELRGFEPMAIGVRGTRALDGTTIFGSKPELPEGAPLDPA